MGAAIILFCWAVLASALPFIRDGQEEIASEGAGAEKAPVS